MIKMKTDYCRLEEEPLAQTYLTLVRRIKPEGYDEEKVKGAIKKGLANKITKQQKELEKLEEEFNEKKKEYNRKIEFLKQKESIIDKGNLDDYQESFLDR